jgi:hypothetical protein
MTSSTTATPSTIRENGVPSSPRSRMMREITGMLVTAIAIAKISRNDRGLPDGP